ncbi:MAG: CopG family transcriptional regulator [Bacteroidetes bacterium]|nr:CopG family transcriptional regulator [Bacteroidota bacterium]
METQNITLSIPKSTLHKVKLVAVRRETSISKLMAEAMEKLASEDESYIQARDRQLALLEKGFDLGFGESKLPSRDELHERK